LFELTHIQKSSSRKLIIAQSAEDDGNMSFARGASSEVITNRRKFLGRLGLSLNNLVAPHLIHGDNCELVDTSFKTMGAFTIDDAVPDTDALITGEPGLILAVTTADCLPVFIWDEEFTHIGIAHAGWKGLADGVLKKTVRKLKDVRGGSLYNVHAHIGVGIGKCCYIVDTDRLKRFFGLGLCHIHDREGEAVHLDLKEIARLQLKREGLREENITIDDECSKCGGNYPSYRKMGENFFTDIAIITIQETE